MIVALLHLSLSVYPLGQQARINLLNLISSETSDDKIRHSASFSLVSTTRHNALKVYLSVCISKVSCFSSQLKGLVCVDKVLQLLENYFDPMLCCFQ